MRRWSAALAALAAIAAVLTACSATVHGRGHLAQGVPGGTPGFPTGPSGTPIVPTAPPTGPPGGSATAPPPGTACPHITYPYAHLKFDCVTTGLTSGATPDAVWPLSLQKPVETGWQLSEGAGSWGPAGGQSLGAIATDVRAQMVAAEEYGTKPGVQTTSSRAATVAGARGWVLQTTFTINSAYRAEQKLKVKIEKSWIVAIPVGADNVSLWYVTLPDDVQKLWATVPSLIETVKLD